MGRRSRVTPEEEQEIVQLYQAGSSLKEIATSYGFVGDSSLYRVLKKHEIPPHRRQMAVIAPKQLPPPPTFVEAEELSYTVEANGIVQKATRQTRIKRANLSEWTVKYTGEMIVEAESIDQALAEARKLGTVRRIYSVRLKS